METNGIDNFQGAGAVSVQCARHGAAQRRSNSGNAAASFLLGDVNRGTTRVFGYFPRNRSQCWGFYAQDDWKVSRRLTVNYGLRYDIFVPRYEKLNNLSSFDPTLPNPGAGSRPGALAFLGQGTNRNGRRSFANTDFRAFGPRLGLAYAMGPKTVLRSGYGIYYAAGNAAAGQRDSLNLSNGFIARRQVFQSLNQGLTPAFNWDNGFPQNFPRPPFIDPTAGNGTAMRFIGPGTAGCRCSRTGR
jgi:hypothetical protein